MKTIALPSGERVPALGMGTWNIGDRGGDRAEEIATLQLGIDLGLTLIDTAEMYGEGRSETLIAEAIAGRRDDVFLVSKVYPHNGSYRSAIAACDRSLQRLQTDRLDAYLLHWRGSVPLEETLRAFEELQRTGKIRYYGVSNLDLDDMRELWSAPGGSLIATNQLLYNLSRRGIEWDLLPWLREQRVPVMAYSPIEQGRLLRQPSLIELAQEVGCAPAQLALAWLLAQDDVFVIPKTGRRERLRENAGALQVQLNAEQLQECDRLFLLRRPRSL